MLVVPCVVVRASYSREQADQLSRGQVNPPPAYPPAPVPRPPPPPPPPPGRNTATSWLQKLTTPAAIIAAAVALSVANPGYVDTGRQFLLTRLYEKESAKALPKGQYEDAVIRDGVIYRYNKFSGSITASAKDGLMVDRDGAIFVTVPYKNNPERVKKAYYIGQIQEVPPLPDNPTQAQKKAWEKAVYKKFESRFSRLPDLKKIYDAPEPPAAPPLKVTPKR